MSTETTSNAAVAEHNRTVARRWIDAFNARDDAAEAAARTADYIAHAPDSIQTEALDSDAWVEFLGVFLDGFPDLHLEVLDSSADEGMVAQRILFTGTHTGSFRGLPPTDRQVRFSCLEINRMVDGKVAEHWFQLDAVTLLEQLGLRVIPGPHCFRGSWPRRSPGCCGRGGARSSHRNNVSSRRAGRHAPLPRQAAQRRLGSYAFDLTPDMPAKGRTREARALTGPGSLPPPQRGRLRRRASNSAASVSSRLAESGAQRPYTGLQPARTYWMTTPLHRVGRRM
jgi:steroid delta-isomerase-like uncharacterized protein